MVDKRSLLEKRIARLEAITQHMDEATQDWERGYISDEEFEIKLRAADEKLDEWEGEEAEEVNDPGSAADMAAGVQGGDDR